MTQDFYAPTPEWASNALVGPADADPEDIGSRQRPGWRFSRIQSGVRR